MQTLRIFLEMIKFKHTLFALPFAYAGALLTAQRIPSLHDLFWITIAMAGARTAAMSFNRLADRRIDAANPGTADPCSTAKTLKPWCGVPLHAAFFAPLGPGGFPAQLAGCKTAAASRLLPDLLLLYQAIHLAILNNSRRYFGPNALCAWAAIAELTLACQPSLCGAASSFVNALTSSMPAAIWILTAKPDCTRFRPASASLLLPLCTFSAHLYGQFFIITAGFTPSGPCFGDANVFSRWR